MRLSLSVCFALCFSCCLFGQDPLPFQKDEVDQAVDKAIAFLISKQRPDGAITDRSYDNTMTSLSIMALGAVGHLAGDPTPEGEAAEKALKYVLAEGRQDDQGYYGKSDGSRMYGHGITTLMLTEMLGMGVDEEQDGLIHERCQKAIDLILRAQKNSRHNYQGGWRYTPTSNDADLSVSIWQLMALRSAKNDGLKVPSSAIEEALNYLKRSFTARLDRVGQPDQDAAGFSYTPGQRHATFTMTAAGLLAMQVCGQYDSPLVKGAADWLMQHPPRPRGERFFFYGTYYYAQGMYQRGDKYAEDAGNRVKDLLLKTQRGDGSWQAEGGDEKRLGNVYSTAMAVLSLSVKYHFLPIYQK